MKAENQALQSAGLRATLPRVRILQMLESIDEERHHLTAEDLYRHLHQAGEDIGLSTVYRVLTQFEKAGLVARHNFDNGHSVFELSSGEEHDHMVCVDTNDIVEFRDPVIERRQHEIAAAHGYDIVGRAPVLRVRKRP